MCVFAREGAGGVCGEALSKYQFETAAAIGMRHAFHRPLRPAFHFYLYLPGCLSPLPPLSRRRIPMSPGHPVRGRKRASRRRRRRRRCEGVSSRVSLLSLSIFYDILFPIRGEKASGHHGASRALFDFYGVKS